MDLPKIEMKGHDLLFDKDARGAHETRWKITQNGEIFSLFVEHYDAYKDEWTQEERKGIIEGFFPIHEIVRLRFEDGDVEFLSLKEKDFVSNDDDVYSHFDFNNFNHNNPEHLDELASLCGELLGLILNEEYSFSFKGGVWDKTDADHIWEKITNTDKGMKLRCLLDTRIQYDRIRIEPIESHVEWYIKVGIHYYDDKVHGYLLGRGVAEIKDKFIKAAQKYYKKSNFIELI